jgi:hypothetical protein
MKRMPLRTSAIAIALTLAAILAACGGGNGTSVPSAGSAVAPIGPGTQVNSYGSQSAAVSVTIAIPHHAETEAAQAATRLRVQAIHGKKKNDPTLHTMANTGATATVRAAGARLNAWAIKYEQSTGRSPSYVSPGTYYMEFTVYSGSTLVQDGYYGCSDVSNTCTGTFSVPIGTGYTASLYLYDDCSYLLSAGSVNNFAVTSGTNNLTITLNGVVAYLDVTSPSTIVSLAQSQAVTINVTPLDAEYFNSGEDNTITTPGVLVNASFVPITAVTLALGSAYTDVTPTAPTTLTVPTLAQTGTTPYTLAPTGYTFTATGPESGVTWTATAVATGNPIVPTTETGPYGYGVVSPGSSTGSLTLSKLAPALLVIETPTFTIPLLDNLPAYKFEPDNTDSNPTTATLEFATPPTPNPVPVGLSVTANFYDAGVPLALSADSCSNHPSGGADGGIIAAFPSPVPATMPVSNAYAFTFNVSAQPDAGPCTFNLTDTTHNITANTYIGFDTTTLNVQGKARSK